MVGGWLDRPDEALVGKVLLGEVLVTRVVFRKTPRKYSYYLTKPWAKGVFAGRLLVSFGH